MKPGNGRPGIAPCGHAGEHITAGFVRCVSGCADDSKPAAATFGTCPKCGSKDTKEWLGSYSYWSPMPFYNRNCVDCGALWAEQDEDDDG